MSHFNVRSDLSPLLLNRHIPYYWIGFILADGTIVKNRLTVTLANKDSDHLIKLSNLVKSTTRHHKDSLILSCQDKEWVPKICKKFDIKKRKTYNPPIVFPTTSIKLIRSLFIGYCDGDASLGYQHKRKDCLLRLRIHKNWIGWLASIQKKLSIPGAEPHLRNDGNAIWNIANNQTIRELKQHANRYELPILSRKWNKVLL